MCVECDSCPDGTGKDLSDRVKGHYDLATAIIHTGKEFQTGDRVKVHTIVARRTMLLSIRVRNSKLGYRVTMTQLPSRTIIYTGKEFRSDEVKGHYNLL